MSSRIGFGVPGGVLASPLLPARPYNTTLNYEHHERLDDR